jgi:hypothetical protein
MEDDFGGEDALCRTDDLVLAAARGEHAPARCQKRKGHPQRVFMLM